MISWKEFQKLVESGQLRVVEDYINWDLHAEVGPQRPLFYLKQHCPNCVDDVYVNRLFPNCVFCGFYFGINWEFAWVHDPNKIFNFIVDGHESLDVKEIRRDRPLRES